MHALYVVQESICPAFPSLWKGSKAHPVRVWCGSLCWDSRDEPTCLIACVCHFSAWMALSPCHQVANINLHLLCAHSTYPQHWCLPSPGWLFQLHPGRGVCVRAEVCPSPSPFAHAAVGQLNLPFFLQRSSYSPLLKLAEERALLAEC